MTESLVIAIDGPAASGKGTLARRLADYYHLPHLDTGLTYRAVAHRLLIHGLPLDNASAAATAARQVDLGNLDRHALSAHAVGDAASRVAVISEVRKILVEKQRAFARQPGGAVLDGRDIGTVVCPDADVKLYINRQRGGARRAPAARHRRARRQGRSGRHPCRYRETRPARHRPRRLALAAGRRRALARYLQYVYRGRVPGGPRHRRWGRGQTERQPRPDRAASLAICAPQPI